MVQAFPLKANESKEIIRILFDKYFSTSRFPKIIHRYNEQRCQSREMKSLCTKYNVKMTRGASYDHRTNGQVERLINASTII